MAQPPGSLVETRSIDMVPDHERYGKVGNQFTLWFGVNTQIISVVEGALAVVFGAPPIWAVTGLLLGNVIGAAVTSLHSAQGPILGLPQMISSRAQFGVYGAIIPLLLVVLMYLGFATSGTVVSGQAINLILGASHPLVGIAIFGALTALVAILGYRYIHRLGRVATITGLLGFAYLTVMVFSKFDVPAFFAAQPFKLGPFLLAVALAAGWQLTYGPYVADYSRYLPRDTPPRATFWNTFAGLVLGAQWCMSLGVVIAAANAAGHGNFLKSQVGYLGELAGGGLMALVIYLVIVMGKLVVNALNAYGSFMSLLTISTAISGKHTASQRQRVVFILGLLTTAVCIAYFASSDFLSLFKNFMLVLLAVFTPWSAINLIDFYAISREKFDIPALYDPNGRYGRWNIPALGSYFLGVLVQFPFMSQALYTGPFARALGGTDISWIVGLLVTGAVYYFWAKPGNVAPSEMIYPAEFYADKASATPPSTP